MSTYKPGTVAVATVRGVEGVRVIRGHKAWITTPSPEGRKFPATYCAIYDNSGEVTDVRPLVVLDLAEIDTSPQEPSEYLPRALREAAERSGYRVTLKALADQIEAQTRPPKPDEPTGLGAVVEDAEGTDWHRTRDGRWIAEDGLRTKAGGWSHIDAVRVLSPGVAQ